MDYGYIDINIYKLHMLIKDDKIAELKKEIELLKEQLNKKQ